MQLREMIEHSKKWAQSRGLCERSEVHGEEEWRIPVGREFKAKELDRQTASQQVSFRAKDPPAFDVGVSFCHGSTSYGFLSL